ncbi:6-phosphogluconolactonase [Rhodobacteraceae bacterium WD3A24]|nr:6-phosphogluconolactonase [Rhodobacteraceae bacterium WD3A24]
MELREYPDRELMMLSLADRIAGDLGRHLRRHDRVSLSVPGGSTPGPVFDVLCDLEIEWSRVSIMLNDERWVPESSERSNTRLLREHLLRGRAAAAHHVPLFRDGAEPEEAIDALIGGIEPHLPLSVLLLGMGEDMHTASLIPGADRLDEALSDSAPPLMVMRAQGVPEPRVTLTAPVLKGAMDTHVVITGQAKREALERAQDLPVREAPIRAVLGNATVHWAE